MTPNYPPSTPEPTASLIPPQILTRTTDEIAALAATGGVPWDLVAGGSAALAGGAVLYVLAGVLRRRGAHS